MGTDPSADDGSGYDTASYDTGSASSDAAASDSQSSASSSTAGTDFDDDGALASAGAAYASGDYEGSIAIAEQVINHSGSFRDDKNPYRAMYGKVMCLDQLGRFTDAAQLLNRLKNTYTAGPLDLWQRQIDGYGRMQHATDWHGVD